MSWAQGMNMRTWILRPLALVAGLAVLCGCNKEDYKLSFSHNLHVTENSIDCADCHGKVKDGRFKTPTHEACKECHGDWIDTKEISKKTCGMCHVVKDMNALSAKRSETKAAKSGTAMVKVLVHTASLTNRCSDCHGSLMDAKLKTVPPMTRSAKIALRDRSHSWKMDCKTCHVDMDRDTPPSSHRQNWTKRHGALGSQSDNVCAVCHTATSCRECHQSTMPESHNNLWRLKTHGVQASWDRNRCRVCHEEDSCVTCHSETKPQSHNASWEKTHCYSCHFAKGASGGRGCAMCHESSVGNHPNPHAANFRDQHCTTCHTGSPETEQCKVCHGGDLIGAHPNPHAANFRDQHCTTCHAGSPETEKCKVCHGGDLIGAHPNPHAANFRDQHCTTCHAGSRETEQCKVCHGGDLIGAHPNPHAANFRNQHCTTCHAGSPDTEQCKVCHGNDLIGGHSNPHAANWGSQHCTSCHPGNADTEQCKVCHGGDLVGPHPNPHPASFRTQHCDTCHPGNAATEQCKICHGGDLVGPHSDPHPVRWREGHCNSCHEGTPEADKCGICHPGGASVRVHSSEWPPTHELIVGVFACSDCHPNATRSRRVRK